MQDMSIYKNSFLIIGGPCTKKSKVSKILSKQLNIKLINLDREKHTFFEDFTDFDSDKYYNLIEKYGKFKALNYIHKYEMKHLAYVLDNLSSSSVIDFGNTYTLIDNVELLNIIKNFKNIIWLQTNEYMNEYDMQVSNNKINNDIATMKIIIDDLDDNTVVDNILNIKEMNDIL